MRRFCAALVLTILLLPPMPARAVVQPPALSAAAAVLVDSASGRVLYAHNAHQQRHIASITKLMTALVAVECGHDLDATVTVDAAWTLVEGSSMYLKPGEEVTLRTLLYGLLLASGNDAALAVAEVCAGSVEEFVSWMNLRAQSLGMAHSRFTNPSGLSDENHYSTAADMATLAVACLGEDLVAEIVSTASITLGTRTLTNHNKLLRRYDGCTGMKTGYTEAAGRTLVSSATRDGQTLVAVTLHAPDDWDDHTALLDYGFSAWPQINLCSAGRDFRRIPVGGSLVRFVSAQIQSDVAYPLSLTETVRAEVTLPQMLEAPVEVGSIVGGITFYCGSAAVGHIYLVSAADVRRDVLAGEGLAARLLGLIRGEDPPLLRPPAGLWGPLSTQKRPSATP